MATALIVILPVQALKDCDSAYRFDSEELHRFAMLLDKDASRGVI